MYVYTYTRFVEVKPTVYFLACTHIYIHTYIHLDYTCHANNGLHYEHASTYIRTHHTYTGSRSAHTSNPQNALIQAPLYARTCVNITPPDLCLPADQALHTRPLQRDVSN